MGGMGGGMGSAPRTPVYPTYTPPTQPATTGTYDSYEAEKNKSKWVPLKVKAEAGANYQPDFLRPRARVCSLARSLRLRICSNVSEETLGEILTTHPWYPQPLRRLSPSQREGSNFSGLSMRRGSRWRVHISVETYTPLGT